MAQQRTNKRTRPSNAEVARILRALGLRSESKGQVPCYRP